MASLARTGSFAHNGSGDYASERHKWVDETSIDGLFALYELQLLESLMSRNSCAIVVITSALAEGAFRFA